MSDLRDLAMKELVKRIGPFVANNELTSVIRWPDAAPGEKDMPCVLIIEADDEIVKRSSGNGLGYPLKREFITIVETWYVKTSDLNIREKEKQIKYKILEGNGALIKGVSIREKKTVGPINGAIAQLIGMRTFYEIRYTDIGENN